MKPMDEAFRIDLEHYVHGLLAEHLVERRYDKNFVAHCVEFGGQWFIQIARLVSLSHTRTRCQSDNLASRMASDRSLHTAVSA